MIATYLIDTKEFNPVTSRFYTMLIPAEKSTISVKVGNEKVYLKCLHSISGTCEGCYFNEQKICPKDDYNTVGLACCPGDREDGIHTIYKKIESNEKRR